MKKLLRFAAVAATGLGLAAPAMVSAQTASVSTQGPNSKAQVKVNNKNTFNSDVKNNVTAKLKNDQKSSTGNAKAHNNTTVGNVGTGNASVDNATNVSVTLDNSNANSACGCEGGTDQTVDATTEGPNSPVYVDIKNENKVTTKVTNNVSFDSKNKQSAKSGNASASNNTTVGDVTSGDATANNSTTVDLSITN
jgi:hypothetical protein